MSTMQCNIVSAEKSVFSGEIELLVANGVQGDLGVLPGHAPLLTQLQPGPVRIKQDGVEQVLYVSGGFLEVQPKVVSILADTVIRVEELDSEAAEEAKSKALEAISSPSGDVDYYSVLRKLDEATAQIRAINIYRTKGKI